MFTHQTKIRVRYGETDQMGYLYYGHYAQYYEVGRAEAIRSLGLSYKSMEVDLGILMPVMTLNMRYVRPAHYDELLSVQTQLRRLPNRTITFHVEVYNEQAQLVNGGLVKLCFLDANSKQSVEAPRQLIERLKPFFDEGTALA
ncbi:MAG: thioesterase family protein [Bacteroidota bacterium]